MTDFIQNIVNQAFEVANNAQLLDEVEFLREMPVDISTGKPRIDKPYDPSERPVVKERKMIDVHLPGPLVTMFRVGIPTNEDDATSYIENRMHLTRVEKKEDAVGDYATWTSQLQGVDNSEELLIVLNNRYEVVVMSESLDDLNRVVQRRVDGLDSDGNPKTRRMKKETIAKVKASVDSINADYPRTPSGRGPDIKEMVRLTVTKTSLGNKADGVEIQNGIAIFRNREYEVDSISEDSADGIISVNLSRNL